MSNIFERKWPNFDKQNILFIYFLIEWNERFKTDEKDCDYSTEIFLTKMFTLFDTYAPFKIKQI